MIFAVDDVIYTLFFYKNVQAEINQNFKNILRTYPGESQLRTSLFCSFFLCE